MYAYVHFAQVMHFATCDYQYIQKEDGEEKERGMKQLRTVSVY